MQHSLRHGTLLMCMVLLSACASKPPASSSRYHIDQDRAPDEPFDARHVVDAVPRVEPRSRYGNPATYVVFGKTYRVMDSADGFREEGLASWYGTKFHGHRTSSGEPYDMYQMTAAHKSLPLPSYVRVTNKRNGKSAIVRVNDRGPFVDGRIIDLSYAAALRLDVVGTGTAPVKIEVLDPHDYLHAEPRREESREIRLAAAEGEASGNLFIQLGAFSESTNALGLKGRLEGAGIRPVRIEEETDRRLFRVRVGPFASPGSADETAIKLVALGIADFRIVTE